MAGKKKSGTRADTKRDPATLDVFKELALPLDAVTQTFAILAVRGVGKTYGALRMAEELFKKNLQVIIADPVGVCWGLRVSGDGNGPGLPIIVLGGDHGDYPLPVDSGESIAQLVVDEGISLVLDLSLMRKHEVDTFMTAFAETLYRLKAQNRKPLHLIFDEADTFAPQRPMPGERRMLGAVEDLVRRGRARGIGMTMVTQRAAVLNKHVLTQISVLIAMRVPSPQDRKAMDHWIEAHGTEEERDTLMESLASLPIGTAWIWSPGWLKLFKRVRFNKRTTFDSSATPKVGSVIPKVRAEVDIKKIRAALGGQLLAADAASHGIPSGGTVKEQLQAALREIERLQKLVNGGTSGRGKKGSKSGARLDAVEARLSRLEHDRVRRLEDKVFGRTGLSVPPPIESTLKVVSSG